MIEHYRKLLELASSQKEALKEGRYEEAVKLNEKRQKIINKIQDIDVSGPPGEIPSTIEKILSIDAEMQDIVRASQSSLRGKADHIRKVKAFCQSAAPSRGKGKLDTSA